jgi:DNA-binding beta-propeller fold protein YncE
MWSILMAYKNLNLSPLAGILTFMIETAFCSFSRQISGKLSHLPPATWLSVMWALAFIAIINANGASSVESKSAELVGHRGFNRTVLPVGQTVTPLGLQVELPGLRPQVMALSPDGDLLAVSGKTSEIVILDAKTGIIRQKVNLPSEKQSEPAPSQASANILEPDTKGQVSYTGMVFSPDGRFIYLSNVNGSIKVFNVTAHGTVTASHSITLPLANAPRRKEEIPAGIRLSASGGRLYVCANLSNQLLEIDTATGAVLRAFPTGVAPYDVVLVGDRAFVSNWGGGQPKTGDLTGPAGRGTLVKVDPVRNIACDGSVTVISLSGPDAAREISTGLHASALAVSPDERFVVCANAASDNLSVIDVRTLAIVETIWAKSNPSDLFGASPNALAFDGTGQRLYVANGTQNAIAIIKFSPVSRESKLIGLLPVGWFPGAIVYDASHRQLCVANIKGHAVRPKTEKVTGGVGFNSHQYHGSVSLIKVPANRTLASHTRTVYENYRRDRMLDALQAARPGQKAIPVPERIGEPSVIKHVVYVIKENRTYDQVFGDIPEANGHPRLCTFGAKVTPNQHKMVREFVLLDNTYCAAILSADGHQWSTTAFGTDYLEKSFAGWPRSYPDGMGEDENDALAYSPTGFIWDNALAHGKSIWNFGEFAMPACRWADTTRKDEATWTNFWNEFLLGKGEVIIASQPSVETMRPFTPTNYVGWNMDVPDAWRARHITNQIARWESEGRMPELVLICLPNDHTSGTSKNCPTPSACVADNDLAFGQIVQALSHSRFWPQMAIFGIEDDPQAGWDHVSGYRTTAYVISPWAKRNAVVSVQYNTVSLLRTIEQILGLPPMNQFDASATPMFDCFALEPDLTPFLAVPNNIPLDQMNPDPKAISDRVLRRDAQVSSRLNFKQVDRAPEDILNRILWHATMGTKEPFPSWAVTLVEKDND